MAQVVYLLMLCISIIISQAFSQSLENCKRVASEDALKQLCDSKSYEVVVGTDMDTLLDCVMREFKLIDSSGEGIHDAIYYAMKRVEDHKDNNYILEHCIFETYKLKPEITRAHMYYKCVMESESKHIFKKAFNGKVCGSL
uniref:Short from D7 salivary protein n=1 Tax=Anopheles darlingi TaxID=43151 RepID=B6DDQ7_ANODA